MKIILSTLGMLESEDSFLLLPDSAFAKPGNPFFLPDFDDTFHALPATALRIGKVGKSIASRFADRYVEAMAPAAVVIAAGVFSGMRRDGLPWAPAMAYDRSVLTGNFLDARPLSINEVMREAIQNVSQTMTLKTGDILLVANEPYLPENLPQLRIGEEFSLLAPDNETIYKFRIR